MELQIQSKASILGDVRLGKNCFVSNTAVLDAEKGGPIVLGDYNVIEERVRIVNTGKEPLHIGSFNLFEVAARVQNSTVGSNCKIQARALLEGCVLGSGSIAGATVELRGCRVGQGQFVGSGVGPHAVSRNPTQWQQFMREYESSLCELNGQRKK